MTWHNTQYNDGVTLQPWVDLNAWYFDVPKTPGHVNCIISERPGYAMNKHIVIRYFLHRMSGNPKFVGFGDPVEGLPPNFRPMLTSGDVLAHRWYPQGLNCGLLTPENYEQIKTINVPLDVAHWQDVNGHPATENPNGFMDVVTHPGSVAIVFGWHNYFAHGLYIMGGMARLAWDYRVVNQ